MPTAKSGMLFVGGEVPEDLALRFRAACYADDRTVSSGLRRLIREYLEASDSPMNGVEPAGNGLERELSSDTDSSRDRLSAA
jgi:hypothetical protein